MESFSGHVRNSFNFYCSPFSLCQLILVLFFKKIIQDDIWIELIKLFCLFCYDSTAFWTTMAMLWCCAICSELGILLCQWWTSRSNEPTNSPLVDNEKIRQFQKGEKERLWNEDEWIWLGCAIFPLFLISWTITRKWTCSQSKFKTRKERDTLWFATVYLIFVNHFVEWSTDWFYIDFIITEICFYFNFNQGIQSTSKHKAGV